jgi:hypothetical protein
MSIRALVELSGELPLEEQQSLVAWAYDLSRTGRVALLLRGVSRGAADRMLDRVVAREGIQVHGLVYLEPEDEAALIGFTVLAPTIVASTDSFRALLHGRGISADRPEDAWRSRGWLKRSRTRHQQTSAA